VIQCCEKLEKFFYRFKLTSLVVTTIIIQYSWNSWTLSLWLSGVFQQNILMFLNIRSYIKSQTWTTIKYNYTFFSRNEQIIDIVLLKMLFKPSVPILKLVSREVPELLKQVHSDMKWVRYQITLIKRVVALI
jgi:hypothetical protein